MTLSPFPHTVHCVTSSSLSFSQNPEGSSASGEGHSRMWFSEGKHGVVPVCLEGLGLLGAGSLLPVL